MTLRIQNSRFEIQDSPSIRILNFEFRISNLFLAILLGLVSFCLYLRTLAPDVVDADGGEFQFAAWNFSFVHPTGYPLYLILGGIFQHLIPFSTPAYWLNAFTALTAALAVAALYFVVQEITRRRSAALIAAASFAVTRTFWYDASAAESYALNAFFIALLICLALRWQRQPSARTFTAFCFVCGLALTHHRTIILWIPAFVLFFVCCVLRVPSSGLRFTFYVLRFTFYFLLPLLLYLYIPLRAPVSPYAALTIAPGNQIVLYDNSLEGFTNYVLGRTFQSELRWDAVSAARLASVPQGLLDQFGALGLGLGILGLAVMLWRRDWARLALVGGGFVANVLFASVYHIGDIFHYYIPAYLAWAVWVGVGVDGVLGLVRNSKFKIQGSRIGFRILNFEFGFSVLWTLLLLMPQLIVNLPYADRSGETNARGAWLRYLQKPIPQNAIVISNDRDEMMPLWYLQYVENRSRDMLGLFPLITPAPQHANVGRLIDSVLGLGRPVYLWKPMPGIETKFWIAADAGLSRVIGRTRETPPRYASNALFADRVRVIGYDAARESSALRVAIYWQPRVKLERNYTTFVHLLDARGDKIAQGNDHQVGGEFYPTSFWEIGETLRDEQTITLPPDIASGTYRLLVGMYSSPDGLLGAPIEIGVIELK